jgi:hypothetical protein
MEPLEPWSAGDSTISAPYSSRIWRRSAEVFSGITTTRLYPRRRAMRASEMPVLPLDGSSRVSPGWRRPVFSASSTIALAMRSFTLPVGLALSSLAHSRTPSRGDRCGRPISGVFPIESARSS